MVTLEKARYVNFLNVKDTTVPYADQGLVLIVGENGNGKSTLFIEGPHYGLYGGSIRYGEKPGTSIMRKGQKSFAVILEVNIDGSRYTIARCKRFKENGPDGQPWPDGLTVWKDGVNEARGSAAETQKWLDRLIGMGPKTFLSSVMFTAETMKFPSLGDAKKKEILDELLQLEALDVALERSRAERKRLEGLFTTEKAKQDLLKQQCPSIEQEILELADSNLAWAKDRERREANTTKELAKGEETLRERLEEQRTIRDALTDAQTKYASRQKKIEKAREVIQLQREDFIARKTTLASRHENQVAVVAALNQEKREKENLMGGACPKCGQSVHTDEEWLRERDKLIAAEEKKLKTLEAQTVQIQKESEELRAATAQLNEASEDLSKRQKKIGKVTDMLDQVKDKVSSARELVKLTEERLKSIQEEKNPYKARIESAEERLSAAKQQVRSLDNSLMLLGAETEDEKLLEQCFGNKGCRTLLLDRVIPSLNIAAAEVRKLLDTQIMVSFNVRAADEAYAGSFEVLVDNPGKADSYAGDSSGERRRVDMIMMFSLLRLASKRGAKSFSQGFFDESFENLDEHGQQGVINLLKHEASQRSSLFALTHASNEIKGNVSKVWHIYPDGRIDFGTL